MENKSIKVTCKRSVNLEINSDNFKAYVAKDSDEKKVINITAKNPANKYYWSLVIPIEQVHELKLFVKLLSQEVNKLNEAK